MSKEGDGEIKSEGEIWGRKKWETEGTANPTAKKGSKRSSKDSEGTANPTAKKGSKKST